MIDFGTCVYCGTAINTKDYAGNFDCLNCTYYRNNNSTKHRYTKNMFSRYCEEVAEAIKTTLAIDYVNCFMEKREYCENSFVLHIQFMCPCGNEIHEVTHITGNVKNVLPELIKNFISSFKQHLVSEGLWTVA